MESIIDVLVNAVVETFKGVQEQTQDDYALAGPSKG